jgi:hypothetical protein
MEDETGEEVRHMRRRITVAMIGAALVAFAATNAGLPWV